MNKSFHLDLNEGSAQKFLVIGCDNSKQLMDQDPLKNDFRVLESDDYSHMNLSRNKLFSFISSRVFHKIVLFMNYNHYCCFNS